MSPRLAHHNFSWLQIVTKFHIFQVSEEIGHFINSIASPCDCQFQLYENLVQLAANK